jgi:hypothetical protein
MVHGFCARLRAQDGREALEPLLPQKEFVVAIGIQKGETGVTAGTNGVIKIRLVK